MIEARNQLQKGPQRRTLDPIITLKVPSETPSSNLDPSLGSRSSVSSVCFVSRASDVQAPPNDSDSSDDEDIQFRCNDLLRREKGHDDDLTASARDSVAALSLSESILASCHTNGDAFLWNVGRRRIVANFGGESHRRGPGMALRRMGDKIMYHTRDAQGTVSLHDTKSMDTLVEFQTHSYKYCTAAPCAGNDSLLVLPTEHYCFADVRDIRVPPSSPPAIRIHAAGNDNKEHGMITSLAMSESTAGRPVVACGMESGTIFFHNLLMSGQPETAEATAMGTCNIKLGNDPVLGLDLAASPSTGRSFVAVAGMAGTADILSDLPEEERWRVAVVKTTFSENTMPTARLRAKLSTCQVGGPDDSSHGGKPGVNLCRFRPDGRVFGVAGWDRRLRIFDRTGDAAPLAILKGHTASVTAMDWAPDAQQSGFLATGAKDGRIFIWRCFSTG